MNKTAIKNFAIWARNKLIADISYKAGLLGITEKGIKSPLPQSTQTVQFFDIGTKEPSSITGIEIQQRKKLVEEIERKAKQSDYVTAYKNVIEEVAYTWFNRLIAIRFMEVNDYLPTRIRALSSESNGKAEPDLVTHALEANLDYSAFEKDRIVQLKQGNKLDELFRMLFIKQCNALNDNLPKLFEKTSDYTELLLNVSFTDKEGVVYHLVNDISEDDFNVSKEGQVEIIGWLYQYYNADPKDDTFALLKKNVKITKERIPAATQLFTPDWIVRYMVENSLGRLWLEGHPNDKIKSTWEYYLDDAAQEENVQVQLKNIRDEYKNIKPEDIKVLDPAMGSGHILVYAFDVLMQIYESHGYSQRDASKSIIENNLFGLDIDIRAYQLAYFSVMMKARQYNRRILNGESTCHVYAIQESNEIDSNHLKYFGAGFRDVEKNEASLEMRGLLDAFFDAKEYGSILKIENYNWGLLRKFTDDVSVDGQISLDSFRVEISRNQLHSLINIGEVMAKRYEVVVTNPPYMSNRGFGGKLTSYIQKYYQETKNDMFAVFVDVSATFTKVNGFYAMITQPSIISLAVFKQLREKMITQQTIVSLIHMGRGVFGIDFGSTSFIMRKASLQNFNSCFLKLHKKTFQYIEPDDIAKIYLSAIRDHSFTYDFSNDNNLDFNTEEIEENDLIDVDTDKIYYEMPQIEFLNIPNNPFAYWMSPVLINSFLDKRVSDFAVVTNGLFTCDNKRFLRFWYELSSGSVFFNCKSKDENVGDDRKWYPYNKGGNFRKWYGNHEYVVDFKNFGKDISTYRVESGQSASFPGQDYYFKESLSWSFISAAKFGIRYYPNGFVFDIAGSSVFVNNKNELYSMLAFLGSEVSMYTLQILNPTMNYQAGNVRQLPIKEGILNNAELGELAKQNVALSKEEWDSFETSWSFLRHPLTKKHSLLRNIYEEWEIQSKLRFEQLKHNEERINSIVINVYKMNEVLLSRVEDKYVTVRKADLTRDIKSLISYAVGCMFGRYSLDVDGLVFAGDEWNDKKYNTYLPDKDNILPITDEEYFQDDIVGRLIEFIKVVYGPGTLEENLTFIARAIGSKGHSSREVIRNYFLKEFIKDHSQVYQKRPIYWLFESGKQNGFQALVYMHRYDENTIGKLRIDYLHKIQRIYENEIARMQDTIDNSRDAREVTTASKRKEKLVKQLQETKEFDEKIAHLALARTHIDLDDGVKVNYERVQTDRDGKKLDVLAKI